MLDVCTGSGAIAVIYAKAYPRCNVVAVDINPRAVAYAQLNACMAGVEVDFRVGDLFQPVAKENFDPVSYTPHLLIGQRYLSYSVAWIPPSTRT